MSSGSLYLQPVILDTTHDLTVDSLPLFLESIMPKLRLKRTPEEELAHQLRKRAKRDSKSKRKSRLTDDLDTHDTRKWHSSDEESIHYTRDTGSSRAGPSNYKHNDYDAYCAEEEQFREKMAEAFMDDERLDSLEARFNEYIHIPTHLGGPNTGKRRTFDDLLDDSFMSLDPNAMDEEEYSEFVREGMYR
jgi:hypothetical protein